MVNYSERDFILRKDSYNWRGKYPRISKTHKIMELVLTKMQVCYVLKYSCCISGIWTAIILQPEISAVGFLAIKAHRAILTIMKQTRKFLTFCSIFCACF